MQFGLEIRSFFRGEANQTFNKNLGLKFSPLTQRTASIAILIFNCTPLAKQWRLNFPMNYVRRTPPLDSLILSTIKKNPQPEGKAALLALKQTPLFFKNWLNQFTNPDSLIKIQLNGNEKKVLSKLIAEMKLKKTDITVEAICESTSEREKLYKFLTFLKFAFSPFTDQLKGSVFAFLSPKIPKELHPIMGKYIDQKTMFLMIILCKKTHLAFVNALNRPFT